MSSLIVVCVLAVICQAFGNPVPPAEYDVIVVGLGASGTAAATTLAKAGKKVVALEAQDRIGGRVKTVKWGSGTVEEGAEWIHGTKNSTTYRLARENNITILPQVLRVSAFRSDGSEYDVKIVKDLVDFALEVWEDPPEKPEPLGKFITRRLQEHVAEKFPAVLNDTDFLNEFYHFMDLVMQGYESCDSWNDVTTASQYVDLEGIQEMSWHTYGYKTLFDILLNRYNKGPGIPNLDIKLSTEVTNIAWSPHESRDVVVTTAGGDTYTAPHVIVTPSLGVLKAKSTWYTNPFVRGAYSFDGLSTPQHPEAREQLARPLPDGAGVARAGLRLLFAGEATERRHFSTVHGALDTGFREARRLLDAQ